MSGSWENIRKIFSKFTSGCCCCRSSSVDVKPRNTRKSRSLKSKSLLSVCHKTTTSSRHAVSTQGNQPTVKTHPRNSPRHSASHSSQNAPAQGIRPATKTSSVHSTSHSKPVTRCYPAPRTKCLRRNELFVQPVPPKGIRPVRTCSFHGSVYPTQHLATHGARPAAKTVSKESSHKPQSPKTVQHHCPAAKTVSKESSHKLPSPKTVQPHCGNTSDYASLSSSSSSEFSMGELQVIKAKTEVSRSPSRVSIPAYMAEFAAVEAAIRKTHLSIMERFKRTPFTNVIGRENQWSIQGKYSGNQCTIIALAATAYQNFRAMAFWDRDVIDKVIWTGDYHHTLFRDSLKYSTNVDGRIALDELPSTIRMTFGEAHEDDPWLTVYVGQHSGLLFLSNTHLTRSFERPTLKNYISSRAAGMTDATFVITINQYSHSIIKENKYWYLFDSHGNMRVPRPLFDLYGGSTTNLGPSIRTGATLTRFDSLATLIGVLQQNQEAGSPCEARLITAIPPLSLEFDRDKNKVTVPKKPIPLQGGAVPKKPIPLQAGVDPGKPVPLQGGGGATYRVGTPARTSVARLVSNHDAADVEPEDVIILD